MFLKIQNAHHFTIVSTPEIYILYIHDITLLERRGQLKMIRKNHALFYIFFHFHLV